MVYQIVSRYCIPLRENIAPAHCATPRPAATLAVCEHSAHEQRPSPHSDSAPPYAYEGRGPRHRRVRNHSRQHHLRRNSCGEPDRRARRGRLSRALPNARPECLAPVATGRLRRPDGAERRSAVDRHATHRRRRLGAVPVIGTPRRPRGHARRPAHTVGARDRRTSAPHHQSLARRGESEALRRQPRV